MSRIRFFCLTVVIGVLFASCAPAPAPNPTSTPMAPAPTVAAPPSATPSPQDAAWAKVVQEAKREGVLTVYGYLFPGEIGQAVGRVFKGRYGITVETLAVQGRMALEKVKVEQAIKNPVADVVSGGLSVCWDLSILNLVDKVVDQLPELKDRNVFKADVVDFGDQIIYINFSESGIVINSNLVKPEDYPKSWYDLLDPKWKGKKIILSDPRAGASGGWNWFATSIIYKALDLDYFRRLMRQEPVLISGAATTELALQVARGEFLMTSTSVDSVSFLIAEGAPLKNLALKEGSWVQGNCQVVIKNAAHPNAARLFANWFMSKEGQETYHRAASQTSIRKDLPDFMPPGTRPEPYKLFVRTTQVQEEAAKLLKAGTVEEIFTPK